MLKRHARTTALAIALFATVIVGTPGNRADAAPTAASRTEKIPFTEATATQTADGFDVAWVSTGAGSVKVFAGTNAASVGRQMNVGQGSASGSVHVTGLPAAPRWYFELVPAKGAPLVVADRFLHLASAPNFRDVGGYRTADGQWVKMGVLYRSEALSKLSPADYETVQGLGIKLVCDLRTEYERNKDPDPAVGGAENAVFDVSGDSDKTQQITEAVTSGDPAKQQEFLGDGKAAQLLVDGGRAR